MIGRWPIFLVFSLLITLGTCSAGCGSDTTDVEIGIDCSVDADCLEGEVCTLTGICVQESGLEF